MDYLVNNKRFSFSYKELKDQYLTFIEMSDEEFFADLPKLLHFVAFVAFLKEIPTNTLLCDDGLLHELIHMLNGTELVTGKEEIRELFKELMRL